MIKEAPLDLVRTLCTRWPEYLELGLVWHSDQCCTMSILDTDNRYRTFRMNLSLDGRWTLVPVDGFDDNEDSEPKLRGANR